MTPYVRNFMSLALLSLGLMGPAFAQDKDPLLTEKSTETFTVDLGGLPLSLPVELKTKAVPKRVSEDQTDLSIGGIDIVYEIKDEKTGELTPVKTWVDFQGGSVSCDAEKQLETVRANFTKNDIRSRIEQVKNENFAGYLVAAEYVTKGAIHGVYLEVYDAKISKCFSVSLAVEKWGEYTRSQVRTSLSPLVDTIKKSMSAYSQKGAVQ